MKIEETPEEIAAFVIAVQGRQSPVDKIAGEIAERLSAAFSAMPLAYPPSSDPIAKPLSGEKHEKF